jgi:hypothetical protein
MNYIFLIRSINIFFTFTNQNVYWREVFLIFLIFQKMATNDIANLLQDLMSNDSINKIGSTAGTDSTTTKKIVSQALPELLKSVGQQTQTQQGKE